MTLYTLVAADGGNLRYGPVPAGGVQRQALPCTGECLEAWVPLTAAADLGEGLDPALDADLVGTTELEDGTAQVTYNGFPLFYFSGDTAPGSKKGLGLESFGGRWYMVSSSNRALLAADLASR